MISLGQQSQLGIGIAIKLQNQFSGAANQVIASMKSMKNQANATLMAGLTSYRNYAAGIAAASGVATYAMFNMAKSGAEYQHRINQIAIVGGKELGRTRKQLSDFALGLSKQFTRTPQEIAGAMFENVKAGVTTGLEMITKYQIAVATATDEMLEGEQGVAFGLNSIRNAMNLSLDQFPRVANAVTAAANASQASVLSLNESMQYFANTAHLANLSLEETLALAARLSQSGIRGSTAGTALTNMLNYLTKNVGPFRGKQANASWAMLGVDPNKIAEMVNSGHIFDALKVIDQAAKGLSIVQKGSIMRNLFNVRGEKGLLNLFGDADPNKSLLGMQKAIMEGVNGDIAMKQAKSMMNDLQGEMGLFTNQLHAFKIAFVEAVGPTLRIIVAFGTKILQFGTMLLKTPIGKVFAGIAMVGIPLIGLLFAFRAATLGAIIALNGFSAANAAGGFGTLMRGGLGALGGTWMRGKGLTSNMNGRTIVNAGQKVSYLGKIYKGGQFLPAGFQPVGSFGATGWGSRIGNFLGMGSLMSGAGWGAKLAGFAGKALPILGKIAGFAFKWIPVIGWIWTIVDLLDSIFGIFSKKEDDDPVKQLYHRQLMNQSLGKYFPQDRQAPVPYDSWLAAHGGKDNVLQSLTINIDGKEAMKETIQHQMDKQSSGQLNFNIIH